MRRGIVVLLVLSLSTLAFATGKPEQKAAKPVELEFYGQKVQIKDLWTAMIDEYNKTNGKGITVTQTLVNYTEAIQVLQTRFASNNPPQIIQHFPMRAEFKLLVAENRLVNLQNKPYAKNANPAILGNITHKDGSFYAIPIALNMYGVFYNVDKFKALGLKVPTTYAEFISLCKQIQAKGELPLVYCDKTNWYVRQQVSVLAALQMEKEKNRQYAQGEVDPRNVPELRRALEKYLEIRQYGQPNTVGTSYDQANQDFLNQKAVMMIEINSTIASLDAGKPTFTYAMFPLPADTAADTKVISGIDTAYCISSDAKNLAAADDFLAFMSSQKVAQQYADFDKSPSAIQGVKLNVKGTESLMDLLGAGKAVGWVHDFYGSGAAPELERLAQRLATDKDIDAYLRDLVQVIKDTAPNLAKFKK